jgi:hypothetical protein
MLKFFYHSFIRWLLTKQSNILVKLHFHLTPKRSTENGLRELFLEEIRFRQRIIEQKRYTHWNKMCEIGAKIGIPIIKLRSETQLAALQTEDTLKNEANN